MKSFKQFKEEVKKKTFEPLEKFGNKFAKEGEKFVKSPEANQMKNNLINFFLDKGQEALNQGNAKLKDIRKNVK